MRGRDPATGEFLSPSRSQQRRDALDILDLAGMLMGLTRAGIDQLDLPEALAAEVERARKTKTNIARKRELLFLAKRMRGEDEATLEAIRARLAHERQHTRRDSARLHRAERWRERLIEEGDTALDALLQACPGADRQRLRQLSRQATSERSAQRPPRAQRALFRELRELLDHDAQPR